VCFCAKQVDGLTASRQILTSKKDSIKPPIWPSSSLCAFTRTKLDTDENDINVVELLQFRQGYLHCNSACVLALKVPIRTKKNHVNNNPLARALIQGTKFERWDLNVPA
jgi:hypothetical protein